MFVLAAILVAFATPAPEAAAPQPAASAVGVSVTVSARLVHGQRVTADEWDKAASSQKRDVLMRDASGQWFRARLVENE